MTERLSLDPETHLTIYRDAPSWDGLRTAAVGQFRAATAASGAALLGDALALLRSEGFDAVIGPMDGDTWHSYRLVVESDGRPPFLMEPVSAPQDHEAFRTAGFAEISRYLSSSAPVAATLASPPPPDPAIAVTPWDGEDPEAHFSEVYRLSCAAFERNAFYKPITREEFLRLYMPYVPMLRRDLILMAHDSASGELLGFLFGIPNYQEGPTPGSVIVKTYASLRRGVGHLLSHAFHTTARDLGFETVIHALIHERNVSADRSRQHGATVFRRYALMGRRIGD